MIPLAMYILKVVLISGILFGYYAFALRNERFHAWNRYYLLLSVVASLLIPFIRWSALVSGYGSEPLYIARIHAFSVGAGAAGSVSTTISPGRIQWLCLIYLLIALALIAGIMAGLLKICHRIRQGEKQCFLLFTLIRNGTYDGPFSFFRFIFWNDQIPLESREGSHILRHELAHIQEGHSVDKLLMEITSAVFWINPFFYLMRRELHIIHEFIADRKACESEEPQQYATLLIEQFLHVNSITFANHFFQRQLTRRVHMLIQEHKDRFTYIKRIMTIPLGLIVILFFLFLQSEAKENHTFSSLSPHALPVITSVHPQDSSSENNLSPSITSVRLKPGKVFTFVEQMPRFPGGNTSLMSYFHEQLHYPRAAGKNGISGTVVVQFIVGMDGTIRDVKTVGVKKGSGLEEEAIRVVKNMPHWIPGMQDGRNVSVRYTLPVRFMPPPPPAPRIISLASDNAPHGAGKVFLSVDQMPEFPGGETSLMQYLHSHIRYPAAARREGVEGTVVVQFVVNTDGRLSHIETVGVKKGGGLEEEAIRVVKDMPDWTPGMQNHIKVSVRYALPIRFILQ